MEGCMMRKFSGNKPLSIIETNCRKNGWPWNSKSYDQGGDYIVFGFEHLGRRFEILYNTVNGTFLTKHGRTTITEKSIHLDGTPWYDALLDFIYEPETAVVRSN